MTRTWHTWKASHVASFFTMRQHYPKESEDQLRSSIKDVAKVTAPIKFLTVGISGCTINCQAKTRKETHFASHILTIIICDIVICSSVEFTSDEVMFLFVIRSCQMGCLLPWTNLVCGDSSSSDIVWKCFQQYDFFFSGYKRIMIFSRLLLMHIAWIMKMIKQ